MGVEHAVLLVGGRGTRLWPLTATMPKHLLPVAGIPFIEYQLRMLAEAGVGCVWLAVGVEHAPEWEQFMARRSGTPELRLAVEHEPLDTAGPVTAILGELPERFLVLNGDVGLDAPLADFVAAAPPAGITLALVDVEDPSAYGVVVTDPEGLVVRFVEKPAPGQAPAHTVNAGIYLVERAALEQFETGPLSFERRVFPDLAAHKELGAVVVEGVWLDIGTPALYLDTHDLVLNGGTSLLQPETPHGSGPGAVVAGTRHGAWSWVGENVVVEAGADVRESVVLDGARVRAGARVTRSVIGWGAEILAGARVSGDTLVGPDAVIGEGCELAHGMRVAAGTRLARGAITFAPPR